MSNVYEKDHKHNRPKLLYGVDENGQMTLTASAENSTMSERTNALVAESMFGGNVGFSTSGKAEGEEDKIIEGASIYVR
jgi:hypothetical protein